MIAVVGSAYCRVSQIISDWIGMLYQALTGSDSYLRISDWIGFGFQALTNCQIVTIQSDAHLYCQPLGHENVEI